MTIGSFTRAFLSAMMGSLSFSPSEPHAYKSKGGYLRDQRVIHARDEGYCHTCKKHATNCARVRFRPSERRYYARGVSITRLGRWRTVCSDCCRLGRIALAQIPLRGHGDAVVLLGLGRGVAPIQIN